MGSSSLVVGNGGIGIYVPEELRSPFTVGRTALLDKPAQRLQSATHGAAVAHSGQALLDDALSSDCGGGVTAFGAVVADFVGSVAPLVGITFAASSPAFVASAIARV